MTYISDHRLLSQHFILLLVFREFTTVLVQPNPNRYDVKQKRMSAHKSRILLGASHLCSITSQKN